LLQGDKTQFMQKQFTEFLLVVENTAGSNNNNNDEAAYVQPPPSNVASSKRTGSFQLLGDVLTRFSDHCTNTVTQTSGVVKSEIQVLWTAPPAGSGCVTFKATVVENWYIIRCMYSKTYRHVSSPGQKAKMLPQPRGAQLQTRSVPQYKLEVYGPVQTRMYPAPRYKLEMYRPCSWYNHKCTRTESALKRQNMFLAKDTDYTCRVV
jgi:hypothetical protein